MANIFDELEDPKDLPDAPEEASEELLTPAELYEAVTEIKKDADSLRIRSERLQVRREQGLEAIKEVEAKLEELGTSRDAFNEWLEERRRDCVEKVTTTRRLLDDFRSKLDEAERNAQSLKET